MTGSGTMTPTEESKEMNSTSGETLPDQNRLELDKLAAEIDQIRKAGGLEKWKLVSTYLGIILSLLLGMPMALYQFGQYLDQRKKQQEFIVTREMILLIDKMNNINSSEASKRVAALGLSLIGLPAVPILIENLDIRHKKDAVYEAVAQALVGILQMQADPDKVLRPALNATRRIVDREFSEPEPSPKTLWAHFNALAALKTAAKSNFEKKKTIAILVEIDTALANFAERVKDDKNLGDISKNDLIATLGQAEKSPE